MTHQSAILPYTWGLILLLLLGITWIGLGIFWGRKAKSLEGFMLAGRNVGMGLGVATVMATWITSNTTMLAPQFALELGILGMLAYSTASCGLFLFAPLTKRIRRLMPHGYTSGDFMRLRYGKAPWLIFLFISLFYALTWLVSMGMAGGILLNALAGIPYVWGMSALLTVCVLYTVFGGLYAVIGTDFIQSLIILIGIAVIGVGIILSSGIEDMYTHVAAETPMLINMLFPAALLALFNNLFFGVGEIFHSNVWWSRAFALQEGLGQKTYVLAGILWIPVPIASGFLALSSGVLDINVPRPDMVGPLVSAHILGPIGAVVVFIVLFCSLASSLDSLLAATADLITNDIIKTWWAPMADEQQLRRMVTWVILSLGLLTWLVCLPQIGTLATVLFFAGPMVASTIWPIATGLYWPHANSQGALWSMILGSGGGLLAYWFWGWYTGALVGVAISMGVVLVASRNKQPIFRWERLNETQAGAIGS
jgi:Na+/proline symporter